MKAPFVWFGGKSRVAAEVWDRLGADTPSYIEPFAGSLAVLLNRDMVCVDGAALQAQPRPQS